MIFFIYGPDDFRARKKIIELRDKFIKEIDNNSSAIAEFSGINFDLLDWHNTVSSNSLFTRKRLIISTDLLVKKDKNFADDLAENLESLPEDHIYIFYESRLVRDKKKNEVKFLDNSDKEVALTKAQQRIFSIFSKAPFVQFVGELSGAELNRWIVERVQSAGVGISKPASDLLTAFYGSNLWQLDSEITKLAAYVLGSGRNMIGSEEVKNLSVSEAESTIFALTDAMAANNKPLALKLLEQQIAQGANEIYLLTMLVRQFRILLSMRDLLEAGESSAKIASKLKLHPYVAQKSINQARNFTNIYLKRIFSRLVEIDAGIKSGKLDFVTEVDKLIVQM